MAEGASFRVYQLAVGDESKDANGSEHNEKGNMFYIDKLQFTATINYTTDKSGVSSDETTFEIMGLNRESSAKFKKVGSMIMLRAGYDTAFKRDDTGEIINDYESLPIIYIGSIIYAYTVKRGVDKVTRVVCSSDKDERAITKTSIAYAPNTKKADVIKDLVKKLGFSSLEMDFGNLGDKAYPSGYSVYGSVANTLNRICEENGLMWFTYNKQIRIVPIDAKSTNLAWEVWPFQVIDSVEGYYKRTQSLTKPPAKTTHSRGKKKAATPKEHAEDISLNTQVNADGSKLKTRIKSGLRFKTFLDGRIKLGDNVVIRGSDEYLEQMANANGQFRVIGISHTLDYRGGSWQSEFDLVAASEND